jgi:UDP-N-acetylmuramate: L-alanyl-gamma-D-glutamyl-meso-diaminopimelate ligase
VLLLPPPQHGAGGHAQLTQDRILARIRAAGVRADAFADGASILHDLVHTLAGDEVVLLLSSGPLDDLARSLPTLLDDTFA